MRAVSLSMLSSLVLGGLVACGPSAATLKVARDSYYDAGFPEVWNAIMDEVTRRYPSLTVEDPIAGVVITSWRVIEVGEEGTQNAATDSQTAESQANRAVAGQFTTCLVTTKVFRLTVQVAGRTKNGPWHITVDGEAAECVPGMAKMTPYHHGMTDEPHWVDTRISAMTMAIHDRLKKHRVKETIPRADIAEKSQPADAWGNLSDAAAVVVIGRVHKAALARDAQALRPSMSDDFAYNPEAEGSADTAVQIWSADPARMRELAKAIEHGCGTAGDEVVCPTQAVEAAGARAHFKKVAGQWKLVEFAGR